MPKIARNAEYTKEYNRKLILRLLRQKSISRAEIARQTGLTRAGTSLIVQELLNGGLVQELGSVSGQRGRTPTPLALRENAGYAIGIYLNRDGCTAGLVSITGQLLEQEHIRLGDSGTTEKLEPLCEAVRIMQGNAALGSQPLYGIGISAPGPLDGESGRILNPPRFNLWHQTDIGPILEERTKLPVFLANNATCLASYYCGHPESGGSENYLLLLVDSGVGSGVISKGKVLKGAGYFTTELGHTSINFRGKPCACGNVGCLESYAAIPSLLRDTEFYTWTQVIDSVKNSVAAQMLIQQEAEYLAAGIVNMTNTINIDTVLIAGDLLYGFDILAPKIEELVNSRSLRRDRQSIRVLPTSLKPELKVLCAADVAFDRALMV